MAISEKGSGEHGYALLISAAPAGRHRVVDAAGALHQLAAVPPATLLGSATASVVQLVDPAEPNTVLAHLRTAAAAGGPLLVYLAGQVSVDRRQRLPHLALARTTPAALRYTALPWHWLAGELRLRPPGSTAVLADLVAADAADWEKLSAEPGLLTDGLPLFGTLAPPPRRRSLAAPHYSQALADILRSAAVRPPLAGLHAQAAARAGIGTRGELLLGGGYQPTGASAVRHAATAAPPAASAPVPAAAVSPPPASAPASAAPRPGARMPAAPGPGAAQPGAAVPGAVAGPAVPPPAAGPAAPAAAPRQVVQPAGAPSAEAPGGGPGAGQRPGVLPPAGLGAAAPAVPAPAAAGPSVQAEPALGTDPYAAIRAAARAGRHTEAAAIAAAWEAAALRTSGPASAEAAHWVQVRADLAMLAGDTARACALWMTAAGARLSAGQGPAEEEVIGLVDRAHHCWVRIGDPVAAQSLAPDLLRLRRTVPGHRAGAVRQLERRIAELGDPRSRQGGSAP